MKRYRIAVDIGGTFVDAVQLDTQTGRISLAKVSTTPERPAVGVIEAVRALGTPLSETDMFVHGTTLPLNAVIERKGAATGLITNLGFRDVFEIGRADVPPEQAYNFAYTSPAPLVKRRHRLGVAGRIDVNGTEITPLDEAGVREAGRTLVAAGVKSVAITFLHSYKEPKHEYLAAEVLRAEFPELAVSTSVEITREHREYERSATTVLDAYIRPIFEAYISELTDALHREGFSGQFLVMRSGSGAMTAALAARAPIFTVMSGPAGGMVGAAELARQIERKRVITLDYGGTSLDMSVIEDFIPTLMHQADLEHLPILIPIFDIRCIGAGGGSIAWVQEGLLQVGPQSAGSDPGPIAYGNGGTEPTTTDAAIVLGYINPAGFLGGKMKLDVDASWRGVEERLAKPLKTDAISAAAGVFDVLVARTVGAIREITVERGKDPAEFSFLGFGGAGPLIAPLIMREVGVMELVIPTGPAVFSARGMLMSDVFSEFSQTDICPLGDAAIAAFEGHSAALRERVVSQLSEQGIEQANMTFECFAQCRYVGQEHSLEIPFSSGDTPQALADRFVELHRVRYGHAIAGAPVQLVTIRMRGRGHLPKPPFSCIGQSDITSLENALKGHRQAYCFARRALVPFAIYDRMKLDAGHAIEGPAIIEEETATTVVYSDQGLEVDALGNMIVRRTVA